MGLNNSYCFYKIIHEHHNQRRMMMTMLEAMKAATCTLGQRVDKMWIKNTVHSPAVCDLTNVYDINSRAFWSDIQGCTVSNNYVGTWIGVICSPLTNQKLALQMQQQKHMWYIHESNVHIVWGYIVLLHVLPGKKQPHKKRKGPHKIHY